MDALSLLEIVSVVFSLGYLVLLMRENIWCWPLGIISSFLSIFLFIEIGLISEAKLYGFYVIMGFYGWYRWWAKTPERAIQVRKMAKWIHVPILLVGGLVAFLLGYYSERIYGAEKSYVDAATTVFAIMTTYLEANKILSSWLYWIVINGVSVWLYFYKDLHIYGGLMVIYFVLSFVGLFQWRNSYLKQQNGLKQQSSFDNILDRE